MAEPSASGNGDNWGGLMCGFVTVTDAAGPVAATCEAALSRANEALAPRGPDDCGEWISPCRRSAFAHRRLAVVDLSAQATSP